MRGLIYFLTEKGPPFCHKGQNTRHRQRFLTALITETMHILSSSNMTLHLSLTLKLTNNVLLTCVTILCTYKHGLLNMVKINCL